MSKEMSIFNDQGSFEHAQRIAKMLSASDLVPEKYRETGNGKGIANTMIAIDMSKRVGLSPMAVMQGLDIIKGKPGWSSQYVIGCIQSSGLFSSFDFVMDGEGMKMSCYASAINKEGKRVDGPKVTMQMAKEEGWLDKPGSKWKTMPELMIRYRAASFFGKQHVPHLLYGLQTAEELQDVIAPPSGMITLSEAKIKTFLDILRGEPTQANIDALTEELIKLNVNPEQTTQIILDGQAIIDAAQFNQDKPEVGTQPVSLFPNEGGAK